MYSIFKSKSKGVSIKDSLDYCNLLKLNVIIDEKENGFIIDTGATSNFIDKTYYIENLKNKYNEDKSQNTVVGTHSQFTTTTTSNIEFTINNTKFEDTFIVSDMSNEIDFFKKEYPETITFCGILGNDFLKNNKVIINYKTNKIEL